VEPGRIRLVVWVDRHEEVESLRVEHAHGVKDMKPVPWNPLAFSVDLNERAAAAPFAISLTTSVGRTWLAEVASPATGGLAPLAFDGRAPEPSPPGAVIEPRVLAPVTLLVGGVVVTAGMVLAIRCAATVGRRESLVAETARLAAENVVRAWTLPVSTAPGAAAHARAAERMGAAAAEGFAPRNMADVFEGLAARGGIAFHILELRPSFVRLRVASGCGWARGFLARAFECLTGGPVVVEERASASGHGSCDITVHAGLRAPILTETYSFWNTGRR
jgi:hypothetical protein